MTWFEDSLAFYASYHHDNTNKLVHIVFVWQIFFTAQIMLFNCGPAPEVVVNILQPYSPFPVSWTLLVSLCYAVYYSIIEQPGLAGPLASAVVMTGFVVTKYMFDNIPGVWLPALIVHLFAWFAQIYAHQVYEKRAPAFLDNIVQALVMAPLFVLLEVLFPLGYKPELQQNVDKIAVHNIKIYRDSLKKSN
jgi:2-hydroxy fatty acid dioxygenase